MTVSLHADFDRKKIVGMSFYNYILFSNLVSSTYLRKKKDSCARARAIAQRAARENYIRNIKCRCVSPILS